MKNKKRSKFTPMPAAAAVLALAATGAHASTTPLFDATFPASWNGTGTVVTNLSGTGVGFQSGTATYTTTAVPTGAAAGTGSMALSGGGGIKVTPTGSLNNAAIAADGGFTYNIDFLWNGATATTQKLIDYAGTESLQLNGATGLLTMSFANDTGTEATPVSTTLTANTWYNVTLAFDTTGNSLVGGDISGIADLYVNGVLVSSGAATKGTYGDGLNRPIGIGEFGYGHTTSILGLNGDIYNASIDLGVAPVPEPSSLALGALGGFGLLGMTWKARRRKL
jgi:Concanavalin A-like lectin/glucanases superfamily/PEP-CTERM motif